MISASCFNALTDKAKGLKYSSMMYIEYSDCMDANVLVDSESMIILLDENKTPAMLFYATDDYERLIAEITAIPGKLRLHFVPRKYANLLLNQGFLEWGEYCDFWNSDLQSTAKQIGAIESPKFLDVDRCSEVSAISQKCRLQSRGFEGETPEWFSEWLNDNKVIIIENELGITGFCCVSIYNEGTTLWIREVAVDPAHQGQSFGKRLVEQAVIYGVEKGAEKGFLAADILNKKAIDLYGKYDFRSTYTDSELQLVRE